MVSMTFPTNRWLGSVGNTLIGNCVDKFASHFRPCMNCIPHFLDFPGLRQAEGCTYWFTSSSNYNLLQLNTIYCNLLQITTIYYSWIQSTTTQSTTTQSTTTQSTTTQSTTTYYNLLVSISRSCWIFEMRIVFMLHILYCLGKAGPHLLQTGTAGGGEGGYCPSNSWPLFDEPLQEKNIAGMVFQRFGVIFSILKVY